MFESRFESRFLVVGLNPKVVLILRTADDAQYGMNDERPTPGPGTFLFDGLALAPFALSRCRWSRSVCD
jgi:hypothetical protein